MHPKADLALAARQFRFLRYGGPMSIFPFATRFVREFAYDPRAHPLRRLVIGVPRFLL